MADLNGVAGELRFTVEVKRAETGQVEVFEMVGKLTDEQLEELQNGSDTLDGIAHSAGRISGSHWWEPPPARGMGACRHAKPGRNFPPQAQPQRAGFRHRFGSDVTLSLHPLKVIVHER